MYIHIFHCIKLYVPRDLPYHHFHSIYLNQVFFVINGNLVNNPYAPSSSQNLIKYGGAMYINIDDTSDDNYAIYVKMSTIDGNFATSAIYCNGEDVPGNQKCAIQIYSNKTSRNELDIKMTFIGNKAKLTGNSIFANSLYNCSQFYSFNIPKNIDIRTLLSITFDPIQNGMQQMSSEPVTICLCNLSNMNYSYYTLHRFQ